MNITVIALGKLKEKYLTDAISEYGKRISAYGKLQIIELNPVRLSDNPSQTEIDNALSKEAEEIKKKIATAVPGKEELTMEVSGRDIVTGLPHSITLTSTETEEALRETLQQIVAACKSVLEKTPPELASDIVTRGIVITGGGAMLTGIDELLSNELHVPVYPADNPLLCVAEGTGILLENLHLVR